MALPSIAELDRMAEADFRAALGPLFEDAPAFLGRLAQERPFNAWPRVMAAAEWIAISSPEPEQIELLDAHPRIGAAPGTVSALSFVEQGYDRDAAEKAAQDAADEAERVAAELARLNDAYEARFGFRYVVFVAGRPRAAIVPLMERALGEPRAAELDRGLRDVVHIARARAVRLGIEGEGSGMRLETHYGKAEVSTYRSWATPLRGVRAIPESTWTGTDNELMAAEIDVKVLGTVFDAAYTEGDNSMVVATDTMKNFTHRRSLAFTGSTLEGWLFFLGQRFLDTYPQMERLVVSGKELRFDPALVPDGEGGFRASGVLFSRNMGDHGVAAVSLERDAGGAVIATDLTAGRHGLELVKLTGSAFAAFARDGYTTLPERRDRTLYSHIDIGWRYANPMVAITPDPARYVGAPQVADLATSVFEEFVSLSIQHLVHEIGQRMLMRYPELIEVSFEAQNRTWDLGNGSSESEPGSVPKVFTDPRPPYGRIGLVLRRDA